MNEFNSSPVSNKGILACLGYSFEEWPKKKMQKGTKLEKFRSFRTSKQQKKRRKQRSDEREDVKTQNCFVYDKKNQMRNKATKFAIETEKKTFC